MCGMHARVFSVKTIVSNFQTTSKASVGLILVSDKIFNAPIIAIHCSNAQNVGFENPPTKSFRA